MICYYLKIKIINIYTSLIKEISLSSIAFINKLSTYVLENYVKCPFIL